VKSLDVGDIYLHHSESHVAIAEPAVSSFLGRLKDGHLTDEITVEKIDKPVIPEGREKSKRERKKFFSGERRQRKYSSWNPGDRTDRPKSSGSKREKPYNKEKSFGKDKAFRKDKPIERDKLSQPDRPFKGPKKQRAESKSFEQPRRNSAVKPSKSGQTLTIRKKGGRAGQPKQGGFKPVRRKSSR
jgi:hypothetical protein